MKSGLYHTASEVVCDALRLLEERDRLYQVRLDDLRQEVRKGTEQLDRGGGIPFDPEAFKRRRRHEVAKKKKGSRDIPSLF